MQNNIRTTFGARVQQLRKEAKVSQEDFANRTGIARSYMSKLERGLANPSLEAVAQLAEGLGVAVADLFSAGTPTKKDSKPELIPFASDGSHFDKKLCKHPVKGYMVGEKADRVDFPKYEEALDYLRRRGTAKWWRLNVNGNWGLVSATSWREKPKPSAVVSLLI